VSRMPPAGTDRTRARGALRGIGPQTAHRPAFPVIPMSFPNVTTLAKAPIRGRADRSCQGRRRSGGDVGERGGGSGANRRE
jgi:hypothetical protein